VYSENAHLSVMPTSCYGSDAIGPNRCAPSATRVEKNYGGKHGRPENKGLGAANEPSLLASSFMMFRGPEGPKGQMGLTPCKLTSSESFLHYRPWIDCRRLGIQ
jgi:hypothetical protein